MGSVHQIRKPMQPLLDNFVPFTVARVPEIRLRRHHAIEKYFEERFKPKTKSKKKTGPRKVALGREAQTVLETLDPVTRKLVMEALANAGKSKPTPSQTGSQ